MLNTTAAVCHLSPLARLRVVALRWCIWSLLLAQTVFPWGQDRQCAWEVLDLGRCLAYCCGLLMHRADAYFLWHAFLTLTHTGTCTSSTVAGFRPTFVLEGNEITGLSRASMLASIYFPWFASRCNQDASLLPPYILPPRWDSHVLPAVLLWIRVSVALPYGGLVRNMGRSLYNPYKYIPLFPTSPQ